MNKELRENVIAVASSKYLNDENIEFFDDAPRPVKVLCSPGGYWVEAYIWVATKEVAKPT